MATRTYVTDARRAARRLTRLGGGLLGGARLLTPAAPLLAACERYIARRPGPAENSGFVWVRAGDGWTTRVWVHNYWSWSEAYGIERPVLAACLLRPDGSSVDRWTVELAADATEVIDVEERCNLLGVPLPFEGQLLLELCHERLRPGRPVQVIGEYTHRDGARTVVHGQYGLMRVPLASVAANMRVVASGTERTAMIVLNPYTGPGHRRPMRAELTVSSHDGRRRQVRLPEVASQAMRRVYLDDVVPDLASFLGGRTGSFALRLPCGGTRVTTFQESATGAMVMNHGTVDRRFHHGPGLPADWTGSAPIASTFALCDDRRDTVLTLVNNWGPVEADRHVDIDLRDAAGDVMARTSVFVPVGHARTVSVRAALAEAGRRDAAVAHAEVGLRPRPGRRERPIRFDVLVGIVEGTRLLGEVQVGSELYNAPPPPGYSWPDIRRTRIFSRVEVGASVRTWLFIGHPVGGPATARPAAAVVTLLDRSGRVRADAHVEVPSHGFLHADVEELFPDARRVLEPSGTGAVRVRSTDARFFAYCGIEAVGSPTVAVDHLIGG